MSPSPRHTATCSVLSLTALTVTSLLTAVPSHAEESPATGTPDAGAPAGELPLVDGEVVSYDDEAVASYDDPELPQSAPSTGDDTPGATMGQYQKTVEEAKHLSEESEETMEEIEGGDLPDPEDTASASSASGPIGAMSLSVLGSAWQPSGIQGMDVSGWQPSVNWTQEYSMGARFAYVKATEGTTYTSSAFGSQYIGSYQAGMTRGAYHFAVPTRTSTGAAQADYFVDNGGGWSADGRTLPGLLDIEYNPYPAYGNICFNLSQSEMVNWIESFSNRYEKRTGRLPAIYSTTDWWATCTGNTARFNDHPLMIARWTGSPGVMPNGWSTYDIWQYSETGPFSGDSNVFGGSAAKLRDLAINPNYRPIGGKAPTTAPTTAGPFRDVSASNQFATEITWAKNKKYLNGWSDGTFRPTQNINRDAMAAVAYRMAGSPAYTPPKVSPYKDVSPSSAFYKEITWARSQGLLTGWSDGTFRPLNDIDRNATAALLYRMSGSPAYTAPASSSFKDVRPGSAFYKEIHWMSAQGITTGWNDGTFRPLDQTHRDAMAAFLQRYSS